MNGTKTLGSYEALLAGETLTSKENHALYYDTTASAFKLTPSVHAVIAGVVVDGAASGAYTNVRPWVVGDKPRLYCSAAVSAGSRLQLDSATPGQFVTHTTGNAVAIALETTSAAGILTALVIANNTGGLGQPAPVAVNATATITTTDMVPEAIFTSTTASAVAATTPTGTQLSAQVPSVQVGGSFDFYVINTGSNAFTVTAGTDVTVTGAAVAAASSGHFRAKRTASTTWVIYRLG
jgi:uncharacterized metal-binding protein